MQRGTDHKGMGTEGHLLCPSVRPREHLAGQSQCAVTGLGSRHPQRLSKDGRGLWQGPRTCIFNLHPR